MDKFVGRARLRRRERLRMRKKQKIKAISLSLLILCVFSVVVYFGISFAKNFNKANNQKSLDTLNDSSLLPPEFTSCSLTFVGNITCCDSILKDAYINNTYDFSSIFENISDEFNGSDLVIGNLTTNFSNGKYSGKTPFNSPDKFLTALKDIGFSVFTTSSKYSLDKGYTGLVQTLDKLNNLDISYTGSSRTQEEQEAVLVKDINDIKIGFISYSALTNTPVPKDNSYCLNIINKENIQRELKKLNLIQVDIICASIDFGKYSKEKQDELINFLFENGVDIIIGTGNDILKPIEKKQYTMPDGTKKDVFIAYSLGNFISGSGAKNADISVILKFKIIKNESVFIEDMSHEPIYLLNNSKDVNNKYKLVNINKVIDNYKDLDNLTYNKLKKASEYVDSIIR